MYRSYYRRFIKIISQMTEIDTEDFNLNTYFTQELGLNKKDLAELRLRLEEEFDVRLPKNIFKEFNTIGEIIGFIEAEQGR